MKTNLDRFMIHTPNIVETKVKCPKCNSNELFLVELWKNHSCQWEQSNGKFDRANAIQEVGNPYKVEGHCKECGHYWTIKGAKQIDDIIK
jgi:uncharacterized Zn finger protein